MSCSTGFLKILKKHASNIRQSFFYARTWISFMLSKKKTIICLGTEAFKQNLQWQILESQFHNIVLSLRTKKPKTKTERAIAHYDADHASDCVVYVDLTKITTTNTLTRSRYARNNTNWSPYFFCFYTRKRMLCRKKVLLHNTLILLWIQ